MSRTTDELLMRTFGQLNKQRYFNDFNQQVDVRANTRLRLQARRLYEQKIPKPFSMKNESDYMERVEQARRLRRLRNKTQQIDYFTWQNKRLLFKGQQIPQTPSPGKHHALTTFNRKTFQSSKFDDSLPDNAQLEFPQFKKRIRTECDEDRKEDITVVEEKQKVREGIARLKKWNSQVANRRQRSRKSTFDGRRLVERLERERSEKERTEKVPSIRKEQMTLDDFLERAIMKIVDEGKIYERLKELCEGVTSKYSLRIYRQQFRKLFVQRYGKDRITGFMDMEYIEDYKSIVEMIHKMIDMSQQQILYLTFISFDYDKDNLLTNNDLSELFQYSIQNNLLEQDLFRIINFIKNKKVYDKVSNPELFVTQLNHQTFKMLKDQQKQMTSPKKKVNFMKKQIFTLAGKNQDKPIRRRVTKQSSQMDTQNNDHAISINFETFKRIFGNDKPCFFYDMLYVLAGIEYKHLDYPPQQYIKQQHTHQSQQKNQQSPVNRFSKILSRMRAQSNQIPTLAL